MTTMEIIRIMEDVRRLSDSEWEKFKAELLKSEKNDTKETSTTEVQLKKVMLQIGIPAHIKGYRYVQKAILLVIDDPKKIEYVTKDLYPTVAKYFDTTSSKVERAIRHAIETAWDRGNPEKLNEIFGYTIAFEKGKATNSEFIAGIAEYVRNM